MTGQNLADSTWRVLDQRTLVDQEMELFLLPFTEAVDQLLDGKFELLSAAAALALANARSRSPVQNHDQKQIATD